MGYTSINALSGTELCSWARTGGACRAGPRGCGLDVARAACHWATMPTRAAATASGRRAG